MSAMRLVMVCHANVARSVAAAYLLSDLLSRDGVDAEVASAGTHATEGQPVSPKTLVALSDALGAPVTMSAHRAHQLTDEDVAWAQLIVTMEAAQVRALRRWHPGPRGGSRRWRCSRARCPRPRTTSRPASARWRLRRSSSTTTTTSPTPPEVTGPRTPR